MKKVSDATLMKIYESYFESSTKAVSKKHQDTIAKLFRILNESR